MNKVILMGRLTRSPEVRYSQGSEPVAVARYTLAVNRRFKRKDEPEADFIPCVAFGKSGEFAEKYFRKGQLVGVIGRLQVRSWEDKEGKKHWTTEVSLRSSTLRKARRRRNKEGRTPEKARRPRRTDRPRRTGSIPLTRVLRMTICRSDGSQ